MNGLLVIDKPGGMTSRDAVNRVQRWFPRKTKIGHTGTLDPLATGVLVVCVGAATRLADRVQAMGKSYASRFRLGATSTTDDADGTVTETGAAPVPREAIDAALARFVGVVEQTPPAFSAMKVDGRRAHALARAGEEVHLKARPVRIDAVRVVGFAWPWLDVEVDCGKGTYIRSIARDLGAALGVSGMVQTLRRTRVGPFTTEQGVGVDAPPADLPVRLRPMAEALGDTPCVTIGADELRRFRTGQAVRFTPLRLGRQPPECAAVGVVDERGELIALGTVANGVVRPEAVFNV
ncbi:tRNA pseudouridine(55) synthase TruB [Urbifossiella limnaea]|uniref:tRNA pseudouridine synthase B n=1 Tax=Urbifossiella limnaea TaxID=2528023 RepID=A0A517XVQ6_9BACT|nr:tRNA pseudouridine(55) synthase TruB [Urbifossiella limnaea]QDU21593.1 tRNA pseudouridine synthase B [Urbifossiella limnaea]